MVLSDYEWLIKDLTRIALQVGLALLILIVGFWVTNRIVKILKNRMLKSHLDPSIRELLIPVISVVFKIMVILTAIGAAGIKTTSFAALMAGLAAGVGLSMQGSLSNLAGGILIVAFKPFQVGDYIQSLGNSGTVKSISILYTTLITDDRQIVTLPNSSLLNNPIKNLSVNPNTLLEIKVTLPVEEDLIKIQEDFKNILKSSSLIDQSEPISFEVSDANEKEITLKVDAYTKRSDYWDAYFEMTELTKNKLADKLIAISPTPTKQIIPQKNLT